MLARGLRFRRAFLIPMVGVALSGWNVGCSDDASGGSGKSVQFNDAGIGDVVVDESDTSGGDAAQLAAWTALCSPCATDADCAAGAAAARCIDYGARGRFCGAICVGDSDCPQGHSCSDAIDGTGAATKQCKLTDKDAECTCSAWAVTAGVKTACTATKGAVSCPGTRSCSAAGLGGCESDSNAKELCDGLDNNCDGATDNYACDDGNPCTDDTCDAAKSACTTTPRTGSCDDGDPCTVGDICELKGTSATCAPGTAAKDCDDNNVCTKDACDSKKGCTALPIEATAACYDGPAGTKGVGTCVGGFQSCKDGALQPGCEGAVTPAASESCDYKDDDCDGKTDEGCKVIAAQVTTGCGFGHLGATGKGATSVFIDLGGAVGGRRDGKTTLEVGWMRWLIAWWP